MGEFLYLYKNSIVVGDSNLDLLNRDDSMIRVYYENIICNGFVIMNKIAPKYATRVSTTAVSILDHIITDVLNCNYDLLIDDISLSDHRYLLLALYCKQKMPKQNKLIVKSVLCHENIDKHILWNELENSNSFRELIQKTLTIINENKKNIVIKSAGGNQPWVSKELMALIRERKKFF